MPRPSRTAVLTMLVAVLVVSTSAFFLYRWRSKPASVVQGELPGHTRVGWLEVVQEDVPPQNILKVKPAELPAYVDAIYRVKPDCRLLYAIAEIHRLLSGKQEGPISIRFHDRGWTVRLGPQEVGRLPEIPSFSDAKALLSLWVHQEWKRYVSGAPERLDPAVPPSIRWDLEKAPAPRVVVALTRLNESWKASPRNPEV
ncbi:MAG: hypothetical protein ACRD1P_09515, partial [Thermoanaerobaculia bacterium]